MTEHPLFCYCDTCFSEIQSVQDKIIRDTLNSSPANVKAKVIQGEVIKDQKEIEK